jgi:hypothetical protein
MVAQNGRRLIERPLIANDRKKHRALGGLLATPSDALP